MEPIIVIPARYQSARLPGKPLLDINGKPMIQRVYEQALKTQLVAQQQCQVIVATDDQRIAECVTQFGGTAVMTKNSHQSGTDRLAETIEQLALDDEQIVINVQGDEPLIPPAVIDQVAANLLKHHQFQAATLCTEIESLSEFIDPSVVKVVSNIHGQALYFSRAPIPAPRDQLSIEGPHQTPSQLPAQRHIGLYAYRAKLLRDFQTWSAAAIEQCESLEQLRILYQGATIHVANACQTVPEGIDTEENLHNIISLLKSAM